MIRGNICSFFIVRNFDKELKLTKAYYFFECSSFANILVNKKIFLKIYGRK